MSGSTFPLYSTIDENCQQGVIQSYVNIDIKDSTPTGQDLSSSNVNEETAVYNEVDTSVQTHNGTVNSPEKKLSFHGSSVHWLWQYQNEPCFKMDATPATLHFKTG